MIILFSLTKIDRTFKNLKFILLKFDLRNTINEFIKIRC